GVVLTLASRLGAPVVDQAIYRSVGLAQKDGEIGPQRFHHPTGWSDAYLAICQRDEDRSSRLDTERLAMRRWKTDPARLRHFGKNVVHGISRFKPIRKISLNKSIGQVNRLGQKLLLEHALVEIVFGVEEQREGDVAVLADLDGDDVADLGEIGAGADRPLVGLDDLEGDLGAVRQQGAAPAARAEGGDRRQGEDAAGERDDGPVRREVIGGAADRRRNQHAVAHQLVEADDAVDADADLRRLARLAQQGYLVDSERLVRLARLVARR